MIYSKHMDKTVQRDLVLVGEDDLFENLTRNSFPPFTKGKGNLNNS